MRDGDAGPENEALQDVGPDDSCESADEGVEDGDDAEHHDDGGDGPAGELR